jgi:N-acetylglucosamine kinase-like BadF-type ATPase
MRLFLGIDGGQSSSTCLVGDESGCVIGAGKGGPCNHAAGEEGRQRFLAAIGDCLRQAGFRDAAFEAACLGLSGGSADKEALARASIRARTYVLTHDAAIALTGATGGTAGIVVIAGTGSIAFGRNAKGREARAGGWGYVFGDEGGAFHIVRGALRAVLRNEEGWGPATCLRSALLDRTGASSANELLHRFYTGEYPRARVAAWAPLVDEAARAGDEIARNLVSSAAQALAVLAAAVRRQLFPPGQHVDIRYAGGVFHSTPLLERFRLLVEMEEGCRVSAPAYSPAAGALLEAYRAADVAVNITGVPEQD